MNILFFLKHMLSSSFGTMEVHDISQHMQAIDAGEMTLYTFLEHLWTTDFQAMLGGLLKSAGLPAASAIAIPLMILLGLLWCFFGLKLIQVWAAVMGLAAGLVAGAWDADIFGLPPVTGWILGIILGVLLAMVAVKFYQAGIFLFAWFAGSITSALILRPENWIRILICVGIGLVIGLIALRFAETASIIITAAWGAFSAGAGICTLLPFISQPGRIVMTTILTVSGIAVQYIMELKKRKKQARTSVNISSESDSADVNAEKNVDTKKDTDSEEKL